MNTCCALPATLGQSWWNPHDRKSAATYESIVLEDQDGSRARFHDFFVGKPSIVVFFYTRCDNPWKCSLTVTKLARVQHVLEQRGLALKIRTVAITYDPVFDLSSRLREYGQERGMRFDGDHRMFRAVEGAVALRKHFDLGVNFIDSLVNRHRIELYILDHGGGVAAVFKQIHWTEAGVVDRACDVLQESKLVSSSTRSSVRSPDAISAVSGTLASIGWAFLPKCPVCWATYLSALGLTGAQHFLNVSKMEPVLGALMLINIVSIWFRARVTHRMSGLYLVCAGTLMMALVKIAATPSAITVCGIALMSIGSVLSATSTRSLQSPGDQVS